MTDNDWSHGAATEEVVGAEPLVRGADDPEAGVHAKLHAGAGALTWTLRTVSLHWTL
jgi:hypothetical protein